MFGRSLFFGVFGHVVSVRFLGVVFCLLDFFVCICLPLFLFFFGRGGAGVMFFSRTFFDHFSLCGGWSFGIFGDFLVVLEV